MHLVMSSNLIKIKDLTVGYEKDQPVLENVNIEFHQGDFIAIIGPNGGGKTTFVKSILSLLTPQKGSISFYDNDLEVDHIEFGYLPQRNQIDTAFPISVEDVVRSGMLSKSNWGWTFGQNAKDRINEVLRLVGMVDYRKKSIGMLSGGQLQRVLLARAIVNRPKVIVLDEPNSYLDKNFESQLYPLLQELNKEATLIIVSHEAHSLKPYINRCIKIDHSVVEIDSDNLH